MKKKTVFEVEYHELEQLIHEKLGWEDYDFVAAEECDNDSSHSFSVNGDVDEDEITSLEKGEYLYHNQAILDYLCKLGHIEAGDYLVEVCW